MIHAPPHMLLSTSPTWEALRSHRSRFYSRNLKAFVGYARRQAAKYGIKGSRLASARVVLELMQKEADEVLPADGVLARRMQDIRARLEQLQLEHVHLEAEWVQVCGKKLLWSARISEYLPTIRRFVSEFGDRAQQAELNQGIDWKALSHALRAAFEVREILTRGDLVFPLHDAPYLLQVKKGLRPFADVQARLEQEMDDLEKLAATSTLSAQVDRAWWDSWLLSTLEREYGIGPLWRSVAPVSHVSSSA